MAGASADGVRAAAHRGRPLFSAVLRTVSKRRKFASLASLFLIELWAGVASLSSVMAELGAPLGAFCESNSLRNLLLSLSHPTSLLASQSEKGEWKLWEISSAKRKWHCPLTI